MNWRLRYMARLDVIALRLSYQHLPREDGPEATVQYFDDDGVYGCRVMKVEDVEPFAAQHWERTAGQPASPVD